MHIPETALPVYLPDATQSFYYEALPVRLIFKVGMTASALAGAAQNAVFYTNRWDAGVTSTAVFNPTDDNPFYVTATFQAVTENKSVNSSSTLATKYITNLTNRVVTNSMGNNGKLTVTNANCTVSVTVNKVWYQYGGTVITDTAVLAGLPNVTVNLYQSTSTGNTGTIYNTVTFGNSAGWTHTWSNLPNKDGSGNIYYYHVTENTVAGYITVFTNDSGIQSGTINVNNTAGGIILPATGGIGNVPYITGGLTIIIFALLLAGSLNYIKKRKTGRSFERPLDG
jgi:LPXTG-motif cell wall-anchored protein